ncbi:MAG: A17 family peptidase, partial [Chromatiaceae bacterium]|nr:A17 family peptidase [Candidatus Thioaporhodococcus sediminis]
MEEQLARMGSRRQATLRRAQEEFFKEPMSRLESLLETSPDDCQAIKAAIADFKEGVYNSEKALRAKMVGYRDDPTIGVSVEEWLQLRASYFEKIDAGVAHLVSLAPLDIGALPSPAVPLDFGPLPWQRTKSPRRPSKARKPKQMAPETTADHDIAPVVPDPVAGDGLGAPEQGRSQRNEVAGSVKSSWATPSHVSHDHVVADLPTKVSRIPRFVRATIRSVSGLRIKFEAGDSDARLEHLEAYLAEAEKLAAAIRDHEDEAVGAAYVDLKYELVLVKTILAARKKPPAAEKLAEGGEEEVQAPVERRRIHADVDTWVASTLSTASSARRDDAVEQRRDFQSRLEQVRKEHQASVKSTGQVLEKQGKVIEKILERLDKMADAPREASAGTDDPPQAPQEEARARQDDDEEITPEFLIPQRLAAGDVVRRAPVVGDPKPEATAGPKESDKLNLSDAVTAEPTATGVVLRQGNTSRLELVLPQVTGRSTHDDWAYGEMLLKAIPKFGGELAVYPQWVQMAKAYIEAPGIPVSTKLSQLKSTLHGRCADMARNTTALQPEPLEVLLKTMENHFGRNTAVLRGLRQKLRDHPTLRQKYDVVRNFSALLQEIESALKHVKVDVPATDEILDVAIVKLPFNWRTAFFEKNPRDTVTLAKIRAWLDIKAQGLRDGEESSAVVETRGGSSFAPRDGGADRSSDRDRTGGRNSRAFTTIAQGGAQAGKKCAKCGGDHQLPDCKAFKAMHVDDRLEFVKVSKLHFRCLVPHADNACPVKDSTCKVDPDCRYGHHPLLHGGRLRRSGGDSQQSRTYRRSGGGGSGGSGRKSSQQSGEATSHSFFGSESATQDSKGSGEPKGPSSGPNCSEQIECSAGYSSGPVGSRRGASLRLVKLFVRPAGKRAAKQTTVVLDNGCTRTLVDEMFLRSFKVPLDFKIQLGTATLIGTREEPAAEIDLQVSRDGKAWWDVPAVKSFKGLTMGGPDLKWRAFIAKHPEFAGIEVDDVRFKDAKLLLGADVESLMLEVKEPVTRIDKDGIIALKTPLGWTMGGKLDTLFGGPDHCLLSISGPMLPPEDEEPSLERQIAGELRRLCDLEAIGIESQPRKGSRAGVRWQEALDASTIWEDGRIRTRMLWKGEFNSLPPSILTARKRLKGLHQRLAKENLLDKYNKTITDDLAKGYIRKLSAQEVADLKGKVHWVLPHFVVTHPDKPDRPRRVLDCAAKTRGISLNTLLEVGPNNLANLWGVVGRFRVYRIVINADITEMFSQILVYLDDQLMLVFIWNHNPDQEPEYYTNTRHVFGAKCSPAIAMNAVHVAVRRACEQNLQLALKEFYMDDFYHGGPDVESVVKVAKEVVGALAESSMVLRKFASNSKEVLEAFPPDDLAPPFKDFKEKEDGLLPTMKALGLRWDADKDTLGFSTRMKPAPPANLAQALSQVASLFDLLRIAGPYLMRGKLLFQSFLRTGLGWRDPLSPQQLKEWMQWLEGLPLVSTLTIPRWFGFAPGESLTLHLFSDASNVGYGAVGIFSGESGTAFVAGKGLVLNQKKPPTVPKAELQALLIAVRMAAHALTEFEGYLKIQRLIFWVDSGAVWFWVRNDHKEYLQFVHNRLEEIMTFLKQREDLRPMVRWLGTASNPADLVSRGCGAEDMVKGFSFWTQGPDFIRASEDQWPKQLPGAVKAEDLELKKNQVFKDEQECFAGLAMAYDEFAGFDTIADYLQQGMEFRSASLLELEETEAALVKRAQKDCFKAEAREIRKAAQEDPSGGAVSIVPRRGCLQRKRVFMHSDGFIRVVTRLEKADFLSWEESNPIALPSKHAVTRLIVREYHRRADHAGARGTYAALIKKYSVSFSEVKREVFRCQKCRSSAPLPMKAPLAPLHASRLQFRGAVFQQTGMDFFGPFVLRRRKKAYGLLFTCMTTRAVHLELCPDSSIPTWLNAIERFVARRGQPRI